MYGYGGFISEGKVIFKVKITLRSTRQYIRNPVYFREFGDGIYDATFLVRKDNVSVGMIRWGISDFDLGIRDQVTGAWKGYLTYDNMKEFFEYWDILDRMVLIEKHKQQ